MQQLIKLFIYVFSPLFLPITGYTQEYDVYLLIGQSNMAGRGELTDKDLQVIDGVWLLKPDGDIEPASNPMNKYSTIKKDLKSQKMSPAYAFGKTLHAITGKQILLVVNARGGSSIKDWEKRNEKTHFYSEAVKRTKEAMRYGQLKGVIWHQGERDSVSPESYITQIDTFVNNLRKDLNSPNLPFVAGEIAQWHKNAKKINPIIQSIPSIIENTAYVTSIGAQPLKDFNDPHFCRSGSILLGKRYAKEILQMVYGMHDYALYNSIHY